MPPNFAQRTQIAHDTIKRSPELVAEHAAAGASLDGIFHKQQLPALGPAPDVDSHTPSSVDIINTDAFTLARRLLKDDPSAKIAVLNLASDILPAGPWLHGAMSMTQEEALCYSSTLYVTLKPEYYPWPNLGEGSAAGIFSPGVVVFRDDLDHNCVELPKEDRRVVSVITVAAPCGPRLTRDYEEFAEPSVLRDLQEKIRLVYRMAATNGQRYLVLGAMGCGAYACPPRRVALEMRDVLLEPEFSGWFKKVVFAVYSRPENGPGNFGIFEEVFKDVSV
ncbi:hypothetical protein HMN09_00829300 [Mycena chlorophos]|uniref:Microbial-type PARG catalytic domain-containing protein n=1 Tax=Mycena chlorophos TaxID=658473 RepID=A0A8H6W797_MYCCL|nr:hypothetical protein HMN09_00829300 [Mycena chlorophos]